MWDDTAGGDQPTSGAELRSEPSDPSDAIYHLCADSRRRAVIRTLVRSEGSAMEFSSLVSAVAEVEGADRESISIDLHHNQLPRLADAGIIEHDPRTDTVRYGGDADIEAVMERLSPEKMVYKVSCTECGMKGKVRSKWADARARATDHHETTGHAVILEELKSSRTFRVAPEGIERRPTPD